MRTKHANVLVAPLDWGLGHATRCIPVIDGLVDQGCQVVIGGSGIGMDLLRNRYPELPSETLPGYGITYPRKGGMAVHMAIRIPKILRVIREEKRKVDEIIRKHHITHIISDNRYGVYSHRVPSVIMTHQVHISTGTGIGLFDHLLFRAHRSLLEKFDRIWIVDNDQQEKMAGRLSSGNGLRKPFDYTGLLSRFAGMSRNSVETSQPIYKRVAILSGPEPQRTLLEEKLISFFQQSEEPCLIVRGTGGTGRQRIRRVDLLDSIDDQSLLGVLRPDTILYSRPGFSTLMDLAFLRHALAVFIPTPGQTEQEYLGKLLSEQYGYTCLHQDSNFSSHEAVAGHELPRPDSQLLATCISKLLQTNGKELNFSHKRIV